MAMAASAERDTTAEREGDWRGREATRQLGKKKMDDGEIVVEQAR